MTEKDNTERAGAKTKAFNLRLPQDLFDELDLFAGRTERSINGAAVWAIRRFFERDPSAHEVERMEADRITGKDIQTR
jgi:predicted transcriptional regulator